MGIFSFRNAVKTFQIIILCEKNMMKILVHACTHTCIKFMAIIKIILLMKL